MTDVNDNPKTIVTPETASDTPSAMAVTPETVAAARGAVSGRRGVLMLGAAAASTVVTIRPALAHTTTSVLNCTIPIPDPGRAHKYIAQDGTVVEPGTPGAVRPPSQPLTGEQARKMLNGQSPVGMDSTSRQAYVNYIRRLQQGTSGFTCYASLQNPRG